MTSLSLTGATGNYASTPDSAALSFNQSYDLRAQIAPTTWDAAIAPVYVVSKGGATTFSYAMYFNPATKKVGWVGSSNGSSIFSAEGSGTYSFVNGSKHWIRLTYNFGTGLISFYSSEDGSSWSSLGTSAGGAGFASFDSASALIIGVYSGDLTTDPFTGLIQRVQIRNNVLDDGTGIVFDAKFTGVRKTGTRTPTSFTESSSNAATVSMTGSAWDWATEGLPFMPPRIRPNLLRSAA